MHLGCGILDPSTLGVGMLVCCQCSSPTQIAPWTTDLVEPQSRSLSPLPCPSWDAASTAKKKGQAVLWGAGLARECTDKPASCVILEKAGLRSTNRGNQEDHFCYHIFIISVWSAPLSNLAETEQKDQKWVWRDWESCNPMHKHICWKAGERTDRKRWCSLQAAWWWSSLSNSTDLGTDVGV